MSRPDRHGRWHSRRGTRSGRTQGSQKSAGRTTEPVAPQEEEPEGAERDDRARDYETRRTPLSLTEAALVTGRHGSTLRRYLGAERFPNAYLGANGAWRIPIGDLLNAGLLPYAAPADAPESLAEIETALERQVEENAELRRRLAVAEALADERAERIRDLRLALQMLPPSNPPEDVAEAPAEVPSPFVWSGEITQVDPSRP